MVQQIQMTLPVAVRDDADFDNYYAGENLQVVESLKSQWTVKGEPYIYLWGGQSVGKTHLLHAACQYAERLGHQSCYFDMSDSHQLDPNMLVGAESLALVVIDDIQLICGQPDWEQQVFHLYNRIQQNQGHLVVAGDSAPSQLPIQLADLASRLTAGATYRAMPLSDEDMLSALILRAEQRGFGVTDDVAHYLLSRSTRNMAGLLTILEQLDRASLQAQRKLTIPFVKAELDW